ncbi:MAG: hypothetical protein ABW167_07760 [Baekduia sp.]
MSWSTLKEAALREFVKYGGSHADGHKLLDDLRDEEVSDAFAEALVPGSSTMTAEAAMELVMRETDEAGATMGPAGMDPEIREALMEGMEGRPVAIATFIAQSRRYIAGQAG